MKRTLLFLNGFLLLSSLQGATPLKDFLLNALAGNDDKNLAESIALNIPDLDAVLNDFMIKESIEDLYGHNGIGDFKKNVAAKRSALESKSGVATQEEITHMFQQVKLEEPHIAGKTDAKSQLVTFFDQKNPGGKLLTQLGATTDQVNNVKAAINQIAPAA